LRTLREDETLSAMNTRFLTDESGKRVAVVLPMEEYEELMEDVSDLAAVAERRNEERVTLEEVKQRLIADGLLPG
jgi:PHD/YefM family antitoxin component YafN of YafNO toxin-antitoxin module